MRYSEKAVSWPIFALIFHHLLSSHGSKNLCILTITVGIVSFDAYVKYQDLMYGIILSCELTEGREEYIPLSCMGQL